jgi:hypothetical protein
MMLPTGSAGFLETAFVGWVKAIQQSDFHRAYSIELNFYTAHVRPTESAVLWDAWQDRTLSLRRTLTDLVRQHFPIRSPSQSAPGVCALVYPNFSGLAHETQLARSTKFLRRSGIPLDLHVVYGFGASKPELTLRAAELHGVSPSHVHFLEAADLHDMGERLSSLDQAFRFSTIVYPSIFHFAFWATMVLHHPNQKFVRMKHYPRQAGRFTAFATGRIDDEVDVCVNGERWLQLSVLELRPSSLAVAKRDGIQSPDTRTFGSISRIEKTTDPTYQSFVLDLLEQFGDLSYLYTGNPGARGLLDPRITRHPRAEFLGWVVPEDAITRYSVYLESFPWGGGDMSLLAAESGVPYLILDTPENRRVGIYALMRYIATQSGHSVLDKSFCPDLESLRTIFAELHTDRDLCRHMGCAWAEAVSTYRPHDIDAWSRFFTN